MKESTHWDIGNGEATNAWTDHHWIPSGVLLSEARTSLLNTLHVQKVADNWMPSIIPQYIFKEILSIHPHRANN